MVAVSSHSTSKPIQSPSISPSSSASSSLRRRLPRALVIGARKCGTRALLDFLSLHPDVRSARGEIHYFDRADHQLLGLSWYRRRMPPSMPDQLTLEKSPAYFVTPEAPGRVRQVRPKMRLLLVLRDPVRRVVSDFAQRLHRRASQGQPPVTLESLVLRRDGRINARSHLVATSVYHRHLARWLAEFPRRQMHIVDGDRLAEQPYAELRLAEAFLGLPSRLHPGQFVYNASKGFYCARRGGLSSSPTRCLGPGKGRRHPSVSPETLGQLRAYFARHDAKLERLADRKFDWMTANERDGQAVITADRPES